MTDNAKKKRIISRVIKIGIFLLVSIIMVIIIISSNDMESILSIVKDANGYWITAAFACLLIYIAIHPLSLYTIFKIMGIKINFLKVHLIATTEHFFNGITPGASGGQPAEVAEFHQIGIHTGTSTGAVMLNFCANQIAIVFLCALSMIYYNTIATVVPAANILIMVGFLMNIIGAALPIVIGASKKGMNALKYIVSGILGWKIWGGKFNKAINSFDIYCKKAQIACQTVVNKKKQFILVVILRIITLSVFYVIPFFIMNSLGLSLTIADFPLIGALTTFSIAMTCFVPTPGATGGIEYAFKALFVLCIPFMTEDLGVSGMLLWRLITYYVLMLISFIVYIIFQFVEKKIGNITDDDNAEINLNGDEK